MNDGIGTYSEKTIHAMLKRHLTQDPSLCEIPVGRYVADVMMPDGKIYEIQTRQFFRLTKKLEQFLPDHDVTVLYPIAEIRWAVRVDPKTGEILSRRRSPRCETVHKAFDELYTIRPFLTHPHFHLRIICMEIEEYRIAVPKGHHRSPRLDRIPLRILREIDLQTPQDYACLLPTLTITPFTSADYAKAAKIPLSLSRCALLLLTELGIVARVGKERNTILYEIPSR